MPKNTVDIDRAAASRLLGVSIRTIDRYIRSGKLPSREDRGRIRLDKKNVIHFREFGSVEVAAPRELKVVRRMQAAAPQKPIAVQKPTVIIRAPQPAYQDTGFYKDLYEETQRALHEYQQKLQQANYRIGQLESHGSQPASVLPKSYERREESSGYEVMKKDLLDREKEILILQELARKERTNRMVFAALTYILLVLQPIFWYLLR